MFTGNMKVNEITKIKNMRDDAGCQGREFWCRHFKIV